MKDLNIVLDTNIFLVCIPSRSKHHWIIDGIINNSFKLLLSSEIILEYEEQLLQRYKEDFTNQLLSIFEGKNNVLLITPEFRWNLIANDPDDNKFVDCAVAGNADFIITNDSDFKILQTIAFPKIEVFSLEEFEAKFRKLIAG